MCNWQHEVVLGSFDGNIEIIIKRANIFVYIFSESPRHNCIPWCALFRKVEIRSTPPLTVLHIRPNRFIPAVISCVIILYIFGSFHNFFIFWLFCCRLWLEYFSVVDALYFFCVRASLAYTNISYILHVHCTLLVIVPYVLVLPERDYVTFGSLLSQIRLSSVTLVHPTHGVESFG